MKEPKPLKAKGKAAKYKTYNKTEKDNVCAQVFALMAIGRSIRSIFDDDKPEDFPHRTTFDKWVQSSKGRRDQYAHAREAQHNFIFEEILAIADDSSQDMKTNSQGEEVLNSEHVQRSKLRIDARKWVLGKLDSNKYGDKVVHEGNEDAPFTIVHLGGPKK